MSILREIAIEVGKVLVEEGVKRLREHLSEDEVYATVAQILPTKSRTESALEELEREGR